MRKFQSSTKLHEFNEPSVKTLSFQSAMTASLNDLRRLKVSKGAHHSPYERKFRRENLFRKLSGTRPYKLTG